MDKWMVSRYHPSSKNLEGSLIFPLPPLCRGWPKSRIPPNDGKTVCRTQISAVISAPFSYQVPQISIVQLLCLFKVVLDFGHKMHSKRQCKHQMVSPSQDVLFQAGITCRTCMLPTIPGFHHLFHLVHRKTSKQ